MTAKPWYASKTLWLNLITFFILVLSALPAALSSAPEPISPWVLWAGSTVLTVLNIVLRVWFTDQSVSAPFGVFQKKDNPTN